MDAERAAEREEPFLAAHGIQLKNYTFSYGEEPVLRLGDFQIPEQEIVAITGKNRGGQDHLCAVPVRPAEKI